MTPHEMSDFIRIVDKTDRNLFQVMVVTWRRGPHSPSMRWKTVLELLKDLLLDAKTIHSIHTILANDLRFFRVCRQCNIRDLVGRFIEDNMCHSRAEENGVVF